MQDKVRLEVRYALEGVLSDVVVAYLEERQMVPCFEADRVGDGILATTELLVEYVQGDAAAESSTQLQAWQAPAVPGQPP